MISSFIQINRYFSNPECIRLDFIVENLTSKVRRHSWTNTELIYYFHHLTLNLHVRYHLGSRLAPTQIHQKNPEFCPKIDISAIPCPVLALVNLLVMIPVQNVWHNLKVQYLIRYSPEIQSIIYKLKKM